VAVLARVDLCADHHVRVGYRYGRGDLSGGEVEAWVAKFKQMFGSGMSK